jgi:UDP-N-acetylmuramyl tripeptide synthase
VAGKGHEDYQIIGTRRRAFSDAVVVRQVLAERDRA